MVRVTLLTLLLATLPFALTQTPAVRGGCGFTPTPAFLADSAAAAAEGVYNILNLLLIKTKSLPLTISSDAIDIAALAPPTKRGGSALGKRWSWPKPTNWIFVPLYFHVVSIDNTLAGGSIPNQQLWDQFIVLNEDYGNYLIFFPVSILQHISSLR